MPSAIRSTFFCWPWRKKHVFCSFCNFSACMLVICRDMSTFSLATAVALLHVRPCPQNAWAFCKWKCRQSVTNNKCTSRKHHKSNKKLVLMVIKKFELLVLSIVMCARQEVMLLSKELLYTQMANSTLSSHPLLCTLGFKHNYHMLWIRCNIVWCCTYVYFIHVPCVSGIRGSPTYNLWMAFETLFQVSIVCLSLHTYTIPQWSGVLCQNLS